MSGKVCIFALVIHVHYSLKKTVTMKMFRRMTLMAFVSATLLFAACAPNDIFNSGSDVNAPDSMSGTTWHAMYTRTVEDADEGTLTDSVASTVVFTSATEGAINATYRRYNAETGVYINTLDAADQFSYTYNKPRGIVTVDADGDSYKVPFNVRGNVLTVTLPDVEGAVEFIQVQADTTATKY